MDELPVTAETESSAYLQLKKQIVASALACRPADISLPSEKQTEQNWDVPSPDGLKINVNFSIHDKDDPSGKLVQAPDHIDITAYDSNPLPLEAGLDPIIHIRFTPGSTRQIVSVDRGLISYRREVWSDEPDEHRDSNKSTPFRWQVIDGSTWSVNSDSQLTPAADKDIKAVVSRIPKSTV